MLRVKVFFEGQWLMLCSLSKSFFDSCFEKECFSQCLSILGHGSMVEPTNWSRGMFCNSYSRVGKLLRLVLDTSRVPYLVAMECKLLVSDGVVPRRVFDPGGMRGVVLYE
jgi:hypothetical protein